MKDHIRLPWLRLYHRIIDDDKMRLLAFEDRWHFIALLCLKREGVLDEKNDSLRHRKVAVKMGLDSASLDEVLRRLEEVGLTDGRGFPIMWDALQYDSDSSTARVRKYRENRKKHDMQRECNVSVTGQDTDKETETETDTDIAQQKRRRFIPPSLQEVSDYCSERGNSVNPQKFLDHYEANGWVRGKTKIKDWKACVRTWEKDSRPGAADVEHYY